MRIVIDNTPAVNDIRAIKRYCQHLALEIDKIQADIQFEMLYMGIKSPSQLPEITAANVSQRYTRVPGRVLMPMWKHLKWPKVSHWARKPFDLVHFPGGLPYIPTDCPKVLTTLHGFARHSIPQYFSAEEVSKASSELESAISNSTHFITVSAQNQRELEHEWHISPERIATIPLGIGPEFSPSEPTDGERGKLLKRYGIGEKPFLLYVGVLAPHKNVGNIIASYAILPPQLRQKYQLILVGSGNPEHIALYDEQATSLGMSNDVVFVNYIPPGSQDLAQIYNLATALIFPSYYEGWASPPLEAMACRTPVVASDIPALRESTGDNALFCNPHDVESIRDATRQLLEDEDLRLDMIENGANWSGQFTWNKCIQDTVRLYRNLVDQ